jgi:hypothetical protein
MRQAIAYQKAGSDVDLAGLAKQAFQPWADAYETWRSGVTDLLDKSRPVKGCGCAKCRASRCEPDPCACRCCVSDADLLVEGRVGERRIVSLEIENSWRRPRDIELELSSWTKTPDGTEVAAEIVGPASFTLGPCDEKLVALAITIGGTAVDRDQTVDVADCAVAYADLRIKGCDIRSVRIAVAILPRDCDAYRVDCACGCC